MSNLSEKEQDILLQIIDTWIDADMPLHGGHSYQQVIELLDKLGLHRQAMIADRAVTNLEKRGA